MKKVLIVLLSIILLGGCSSSNEDKLIKKFNNDVNSSKSYTMKGSLEIYNDEDTFNYDVEVSYKKKDMYLVKLKNTISSHVQIIIKNSDGVYVITPSLNKSFKFQSEWPKNSSQAYILESILGDLNSTENKNYKEDNDYYIVETNVNYPNNSDLTYQRLYFDKDYNFKKNEIYNSDNQIKLKFVVGSIDYKANLDDDYFSVDKNVDENCCAKTSGVTLEEIIYPLYIPSDTYLSSKETISTDNGNRAILTFSGSKDFVLIEEASVANASLETIPVYGDPVMMNGMVGAISGNSLYWTNNDIDYYLAGSDLTEEELLSVAKSISNTIVTGK